MNKFDKRDVVYKLDCKMCEMTYIDQTSRLLKMKVDEHRNNYNRNESYHNVLSNSQISKMFQKNVSKIGIGKTE